MTTERRPALRVGSVTQVTEAEGPGRRFAVWAQGCSIRCPGCFNPHFWSPAGGVEIEVSDLVEQAIGAGVEGVTLLGGEPFEQAESFAIFASMVREAGLSVMTFTGYYVDELTGSQSPRGAAALLAQTDLLVDGPYRADELDHSRPWVGSRNQTFHFLTDRYSHLEAELGAMADRLEIRVDLHGEVRVNGWADVALLDELLDGLTPKIGRGQVR